MKIIKTSSVLTEQDVKDMASGKKDLKLNATDPSGSSFSLKDWLSKKSGYEILPPLDTEKFPNREREGLEGPMRLLSGKVVYYDTRAGKYYDPLSDFYLTEEDYMAHITPRKQ